MKEKVITVPYLEKGTWKTRRRPFNAVLMGFKKDIDLIPGYVAAIKAADDKRWGELFAELAKYAKRNPKFAKAVRVRKRGGKTGLSVGEPNWFWIPIFLSFVAGVAMGSCINSCAKK